MPGIKIINDLSEINLNNKWVPATKFSSKNRIVNQNGHKILSGYKGRQYRIIEKKERDFSVLERVGRGLLGSVAVICTLCFALFSKSIRKLFTKYKANIRFAILETSVNPSTKNDPILNHQLPPNAHLPEQKPKVTVIQTVPFKNTQEAPIKVSNSKNEEHSISVQVLTEKREDVEKEEFSSANSISPAELKEGETIFPLDAVKSACQQWMSTFLKNFEPTEVKKYTIEQLYKDDVVTSKEETEAMRSVYKTLWNEQGTFWRGKVPEGWTKHSGSTRSFNVEHISYPDHIFKFCSGSPGLGVPAAHFLRVAKGKEIQRIVDEEGLDELEVADECLIALKSKDEIQEESENEQCYHFVVKSKKLNLLKDFETISRLSSLPQQKQIKIATQIMQMICKSGLGDVGFHNFQINKETGKLVVIDTEPLFGSLLLDEESKFSSQYRRTNRFKKFSKNSDTVKNGLDNIIEACKQLPIFEKVARVYKECFPVYS